MQDTSNGLPPTQYLIIQHKTVYETHPPQKSYTTDQGYNQDTKVKQFVSCPPPSQIACKLEQGYPSESNPK